MVNFILAETKGGQHVKIEVIKLGIIEAKGIFAEVIAKSEAVEGKLDVES